MPETNSSSLKIGQSPKKELLWGNLWASGRVLSSWETFWNGRSLLDLLVARFGIWVDFFITVGWAWNPDKKNKTLWMFVSDNSLPIGWCYFFFVSAVGMYWNLFLKETSRSYGLFVFFFVVICKSWGGGLRWGSVTGLLYLGISSRTPLCVLSWSFRPSNFTQINMFLFHTVCLLKEGTPNGSLIKSSSFATTPGEGGQPHIYPKIVP